MSELLQFDSGYFQSRAGMTLALNYAATTDFKSRTDMAAQLGVGDFTTNIPTDSNVAAKKTAVNTALENEIRADL